MAGLNAVAGEGCSSKKGFGISLKENPDWFDKLGKVKPDWFHTWGAEVPTPLPVGMEFVPMVWDAWSCTDEILDQLVSEGHQTLLGFNEPDYSKQANLPVEQALELWPKLMGTGMRLGSPACGIPEGEWMSVFMKESKKRSYRIDFVAIHSFTGLEVGNYLKRLEKIHKLYNKPLWITEMAVADWEASADKPSRYSPEDVCEFMEAVIPALEGLDYVERYAWFSSPKPSFTLGSSMLFSADGSLNRLGRLYAAF